MPETGTTGHHPLKDLKTKYHPLVIRVSVVRVIHLVRLP